MQKLTWCFYAILVGLLAGLAASVFLILLSAATEMRMAHPSLIYGLPLAGLIIGLIYHYQGKDIQPGTNLILDEIHQPRNIVPIHMAPTILFTTLLTHLFGGSAGREGTAVQMGASLADQLARVFPVSKEERKILLVCGAGAGFGAALGAPFAGIFFGMEVIWAGKLKPFALVECVIASFVGFGVTQLLHAPHTTFPLLEKIPVSWLTLLWLVIASIVFSIIVRGFLKFTHLIEAFLKKSISYPPLKPFLGGIVLVLLFKGLSLEQYEGLGLETIQRSFTETLPYSVFLIKLALTAITLGVGFKGGEFIPLIFMGATAGSAMGYFQPDAAPLLVSLGCVAVFGAASKTPFTCSIMAIELFGWKIAPFAFASCYLSYYFSGTKSIYRSHR